MLALVGMLACLGMTWKAGKETATSTSDLASSSGPSSNHLDVSTAFGARISIRCSS